MEGSPKKQKVTAMRRSDRIVCDTQLFHSKVSDGKDEKREKGTLQAQTGYLGDIPYRGGVDQITRSSVNRRKEKSRKGEELCYDKLNGMGQAYYLYSLPVNIMRGLLQGLKTQNAMKHFNEECKILQSHKGTNYMFMHWNGGEETSKGAWHTHPFVATRPDLATSIESLGNFVSSRLLFPDEPLVKQPGALCNNKKHKNGAQPPHFDVTGWQGLPAKQLPHILHVPLCEEGMMLHVFPSERDPKTHNFGDKEQMKVGEPVFVHIAFGDALILRADVAHGGCYGSIGNFRFHMMLRVPGCPLETNRLHYLSTVSDNKSYANAMREFRGMDWDKAFADGKKRQSTIYVVAAYIQAVKNLYPNEDTWHAGLFAP
jgi:hypothetical protein